MSRLPPPILHVDMDAFYASVEIRDRPALRGKPVCVGGSADRRGVIAAASYEARKFGVHSAMPTARALKLCPHLVLMPANFDKYTAISRQVMEIFRSYTPLVEPLSLDEAFLDVRGTERLFGSSIDVGRRIRAEILAETSLVASIGIASTKFLAKLASDLDKPDGFRVIYDGETREVLDPLPVSKIFGVGPRRVEQLEKLGVRTVSDLASRPRDEVLREFGASGAWIHDLAHGIDSRRVSANRAGKSHGIERTFARNIADREELRLLLFEFCEEIAFDLRKKGLRGRTVTLKARFGDFTTVTRSKTVEQPIDVGRQVYAVARGLLESVPPGALRLLGVQLSNLDDGDAPLAQGSLFDRRSELERRMARTVPALDDLRERYGRGTVLPASLLGRGRFQDRSREGEGEEEE